MKLILFALGIVAGAAHAHGAPPSLSAGLLVCSLVPPPLLGRGFHPCSALCFATPLCHTCRPHMQRSPPRLPWLTTASWCQLWGTKRSPLLRRPPSRRKKSRHINRGRSPR